MDERDDLRMDGLDEVGERLRAHRHVAGPVQMDELKRRAMAQAAAPARTRHDGGSLVKTRFVTIFLLAAFVISGGTAGVIAATTATSTTSTSTPAQSQYRCNSGIGNGSEQPPTPPSQDCDPGNSPGNNATNPCEGPPTTSPSTGCRPTPQVTPPSR